MSYKLEKPYTDEQYADFVVEHQGLEPYETDTAFYMLEPYEKLVGDIVIDNTEEYEKEQAQKRAEEIAKLYLTRGDVFRGLLLAKGVTKEQISKMIEAMPASTPEETVTKSLAVIDFEDALHYYRGVELINTIGFALGISKEQLDNFFIKGNDPDPHIKEEAYKELM